MVHVYDPNSHELRQSYHKLKASLAYTANAKQIRATQLDSVFKRRKGEGKSILNIKTCILQLL